MRCEAYCGVNAHAGVRTVVVKSHLSAKIQVLFTVHDTARGRGQEVLENIMGRVGLGQEVFEMLRVGSGRVRSGGFQV